jgi:hypothetical protein
VNKNNRLFLVPKSSLSLPKSQHRSVKGNGKGASQNHLYHHSVTSKVSVFLPSSTRHARKSTGTQLTHEGVQSLHLAQLDNYTCNCSRIISLRSLIYCGYQIQLSKSSYHIPSMTSCLHLLRYTINDLVHVSLIYVRPAGLSLLPKHV